MKIKNSNTTTLSTAIAMLLLTGTLIAAETEDGINEKADMQRHKQMKHKMMKRHRKHVDDRILRMDTNEDGKIDLSEYMSHAEKNFNEMDADGDQYVTPEEARQRHSHMRKRHHEERRKMHEKMKSQEQPAAEE